MRHPACLGSRNAVPDPDSGLVRGLKCGDQASFNDLLRRYQGPVYAYLCRLLGDPLEAEDVAQEVFVKVFRKVEGFREESNFKTWLYRIATRQASNRRRWFSRHRWREVTGLLDRERRPAFDERLAHPGRSPFDQVASREHRDIVHQALSRVNPRFRQAVYLRDIAGFTYAEIARTLNISLGTVKSRILRGRRALKRELTRHAPAIVAQTN